MYPPFVIHSGVNLRGAGMKTISPSIREVDGVWLYHLPSGPRHTALLKECENCGDEFATYPNAKTRFCCQECERRPCVRCGEIFHPTGKANIYCSLSCKRGTLKCEGCGKS